MKNMLLLLLCVFALNVCRGQSPYNRAQLSQWMQDGAWDEIVTTANNSTEPDTFLLQSAGYASYQTGERTTAAGFYNRLLAKDSNNRQALYYNALMLKADERYPETIALLERLCRNFPAVAQYHVLLADCYAAPEERRTALAQLRIANRLSPSSAVIGNRLANAWMRLKEWDSAAQLLNAVMLLHHGDPMLIGTAINLAYYRKDYEQSSAWADSLIATTSLRYDPLLTGLYADIESRNYAHAIRIGRLLMTLGKETEEVLYYTALAYQGVYQWDAADTLLRKCVGKCIKPKLEAYYTALGEGAAHLKDWTHCKAYYDTAYYLFKHPTTLYFGGITMQNAGRKAEANQLYRKYLALPVAFQDTAITHYLQKVITP